MSKTEYRMAFRHVHRGPRTHKDDMWGPMVVDKEWMTEVAELAAEGWTIHSIDYKNDRCMMEREVND
jgi:hypothetical protein